MSKAGMLLANATWTYGAQFATITVQFAYAAVTSRLLDSASFGIYSVALAVSALVTLLANGGLGQAAGRMTSIESYRIRSLSLYGILLGAVGGIALYLTAPLWAMLWQMPEAVEPIRWMGISALVSPWLGLAAGLMRRQGSYRQLALITVASNVIAMGLGLIAVFSFSSPSSLLVSPIAAQVLLAATCGLFNISLLRPRGSIAGVREDIGFSWKLTAASLLSYVNGNVGKLATSAGIGAGALGQWNRADVLTSVPFQQLQTALVQAIYPEFRHDRGSAQRAHSVWADMLGLVAWVALPAGTVMAVVAPHIVPFLFGEGWSLAASLVVPLSLIGGLQAVVVMLGSAIEALGRFKWIWATQGLLFAVYSSTALVAVLTASLIPIFFGILTALVVQHVFQAFLCAREGYLNWRLLVRHYIEVAIACLITWALAFSHVSAISSWGVRFEVFLVLALADGFVVLVFWICRDMLPPLRLAGNYGLFRSRSRIH